MATTIRDIARACNVSEGTVDRALNGRAGINEDTKKQILEVAKKMQYQPNHLARCLATGSTKSIGVICDGLKDRFIVSVIETVEQLAFENGYVLNLILSHNNRTKERKGIDYFLLRKVDAIILFPIGHEEDDLQKYHELQIPIVSILNSSSKEPRNVEMNSTEIEKFASKVIFTLLDLANRDVCSKASYLEFNFSYEEP